MIVSSEEKIEGGFVNSFQIKRGLADGTGLKVSREWRPGAEQMGRAGLALELGSQGGNSLGLGCWAELQSAPHIPGTGANSEGSPCLQQQHLSQQHVRSRLRSQLQPHLPVLLLVSDTTPCLPVAPSHQPS